MLFSAMMVVLVMMLFVDSCFMTRFMCSRGLGHRKSTHK